MRPRGLREGRRRPRRSKSGSAIVVDPAGAAVVVTTGAWRGACARAIASLAAHSDVDAAHETHVRTTHVARDPAASRREARDGFVVAAKRASARGASEDAAITYTALNE